MRFFFPESFVHDQASRQYVYTLSPRHLRSTIEQDGEKAASVQSSENWRLWRLPFVKHLSKQRQLTMVNVVGILERSWCVQASERGKKVGWVSLQFRDKQNRDTCSKRGRMWLSTLFVGLNSRSSSHPVFEMLDGALNWRKLLFLRTQTIFSSSIYFYLLSLISLKDSGNNSKEVVFMKWG